MQFSVSIPIRRDDLDQWGAISAESYAVYFEESRSRFFAALRERAPDSRDAGHTVARVLCDYRRRAPAGASHLIVHCAVESLGPATMGLRQEVTDGKHTIAIVHSVLLARDRSGGARNFSDAEIKLAKQYSTAS